MVPSGSLGETRQIDRLLTFIESKNKLIKTFPMVLLMLSFLGKPNTRIL